MRPDSTEEMLVQIHQRYWLLFLPGESPPSAALDDRQTADLHGVVWVTRRDDEKPGPGLASSTGRR
jgi:hypothetical protein